MTCIIGLVDDKGTIYMGSDSACSTGWEVRTLNQPKTFFINGNILIGTTGALRAQQILRHCLKVDTQENVPDDFYMVSVVANAIRQCLKDNGYAQIEKNKETTDDEFLVGYKGQLFTIGVDYAVCQYTETFEAVGSGSLHAMGAMAALEDLPPKKRIKAALNIAARFATGVRGPFHINVLNPVNMNVGFVAAL